MKKLLLFLALLLPAVILAKSSMLPFRFATPFYTSSTGSDTANNCQNISLPCNLANGFANEVAQVTAANGDILYLCAAACDGAGSTASPLTVDFDSTAYTVPSGTSWANALTVTPYPGETVTIRRIAILTAVRYVIFKGTTSAREFKVNCDVVESENEGYDCVSLGGYNGLNHHHIRLQDMEVSGSRWANGITADFVTGSEFINVNSHDSGHDVGDHCLYISNGSDNLLIDGGEYHGCHSAGIQVYAQIAFGPLPVGTIVRNARIYSNETGIILGSEFGQYSSNLIYDNGAGVGGNGISTGWGGQGNKIYNNSIVNNDGKCIQDQFSLNEIAKNNICRSNGTNSIDPGIAAHTSNLFVDPLFTNEAAKDFTLTEKSPALDTGDTLAEVPTDFNGNTRPQGSAYDIGAHERVNIVGGSGSGNVQTSRATEAFTGAAGDLAGPDWAQVGTGGLTCRKNGSGRLTASATSQDGCLARQISSTFSANLYSEIKYISVGTSTSGESFIGPAILASDGDGYAGGVYVVGSDTTTFVGEYANGLFTTILASTTSVSWAANDTMALEWNSADGHIWLLKNDIVVLNPFDTTYTTGLKPGVVVAGDALGDDADLGDINFTPGTCTINLQQPAAGSINSRPNTTGIYWTTQNCTGNVTIQASWNGGTTWLPVFATVAFNSSPYTWDTVIGESATVKVRVCSGSDCGTSENFTVHGEFVK